VLNQNISSITGLIPKIEEEVNEKEIKTKSLHIYKIMTDKKKELRKRRNDLVLGVAHPAPGGCDALLSFHHNGLTQLYPELAILHMIKYSVHIIQNMFLTLAVYKSLKLHKILKENKNTPFFIKDLIGTTTNLLYPLARMKEIKIDVEYSNSSLFSNSIVASLNYYKVIFFNLLLFIINNISNSTKSKTQVKISIDAEKLENIVTYKVLIHITTDNNDNLVINFRNLEELLNQNQLKFDSDEVKRFLVLDLGFYLSVYLIKFIFKEEFTLKSDDLKNHEIIFNLQGVNGNMVIKPNSKNQFDEIFYNRFLEKMYNKKIPQNKNQVIKIKVSSQNIKSYSNIESLLYISPEDVDNRENNYFEITSFKKNVGLVQKYNISYIKTNSDFDLNLVKRQNNLESFLKSIINKYTSPIKYISNNPNVLFYHEDGTESKQELKQAWTNEILKKNFKNYDIPIFLIVEVKLLSVTI